MMSIPIIIKRILMLFLLVATTTANGQIGRLHHSEWDEELLKANFHHVRIQADNIQSAWQEIGSKYLLRVNLYMDARLDSGSAKFIFNRMDATGNDLLDAFLATYPIYTYTQDKETGIIWLHPKNIQYDDIFSQIIKVDRLACQVPMFTGVFNQLCGLLSSNVSTSLINYGQPMSSTYDYCVDLPPGNYTAMHILNYCCVWNMTKSFIVSHVAEGKIIIQPINLYYDNPLAPQQSAVKFWEIEIGKYANNVPSVTEVSAAMGDSDPRIRWAARNYYEATSAYYPWGVLIEKSVSPEKAVWTALGVKTVLCKGVNDNQFISQLGSGFATNLTQIKDPDLALVTSLELTREKQSTKYLDSIVSKHKFSEAEIASIRADIYRLAHESKLALDKLKAMKLDVAEFSLEALRGLEDTNIFTLVLPGKN